IDLANHPQLEHFLTVATLCNDASLRQDNNIWTISGDPTEAALIVAAAKAGLDANNVRKQCQRLDTIPFDPARKYMATLDHLGGPECSEIHVKGAPDRIIEMCSHERTRDGDQPIVHEQWNRHIEALSSQGLRVLALAEKHSE